MHHECAKQNKVRLNQYKYTEADPKCYCYADILATRVLYKNRDKINIGINMTNFIAKLTISKTIHYAKGGCTINHTQHNFGICDVTDQT